MNFFTGKQMPHLLHFIRHVGGVAVHLLALGSLGATPHPHHLAVLEHNLVDGLVQHVGAPIDGRQPANGRKVEKKMRDVHNQVKMTQAQNYKFKATIWKNLGVTFFLLRIFFLEKSRSNFHFV